MQKESTKRTASLPAEAEEYINSLIAISMLAKSLAAKLKEEMHEENPNEKTA